MPKSRILTRRQKRRAKKRLLLTVISSFLLLISLIVLFFFFKRPYNMDPISEIPSSEENSSENIPQDPEAKEPKIDKKEVILSATGDVLIGTDPRFKYQDTLVNTFKSMNSDYGYFMKNVKDIFEADDITIANLENPLTNSNSMVEKEYAFKGPMDFAKILKVGKIEGVNLSNNHIYDFGNIGFSDTVATLNEEGINYFGEGNIWRTEIKGIKFAFLGYQGWWYDDSTLKKIKKDIESLKNESRIVVINFHWGDEKEYYPNKVQQFLAKYSIDNGADLIIAEHPHVVQGIEEYKGKFIAYSLGNFCFGGNRNPSDKRTFILQVKFLFEDNKLTNTGIRAVPCSISSVSEKNNYQPTPMIGEDKNEFLKFINSLSTGLKFNISDEFQFLLKE